MQGVIRECIYQPVAALDLEVQPVIRMLEGFADADGDGVVRVGVGCRMRG